MEEVSEQMTGEGSVLLKLAAGSEEEVVGGAQRLGGCPAGRGWRGARLNIPKYSTPKVHQNMSLKDIWRKKFYIVYTTEIVYS